MPFHVGRRKPRVDGVSREFVFPLRYRLLIAAVGTAITWWGFSHLERDLYPPIGPGPLRGFGFPAFVVYPFGVAAVLASAVPAAWVRRWEKRLKAEIKARRRP